MSTVEDQFRRWLFWFARRRTLAFIRKEKAKKNIPKEKKVYIDSESYTPVPNNEPDPLRAIENREKFHLLLEKLGLEDRSLWLQRYLWGLTYNELAEIQHNKTMTGGKLDKTATNLRKRVSRINEKLKNISENDPILRELSQE